MLYSYTAVLERAVKDAFEAVGLQFIGRNYAMGSSNAAPEIALCIDEIFGTDIDVLVWDFGAYEATVPTTELLQCDESS
jgi:hypothetical protein